VQPNFSDVPGTPTTADTVVWASLGTPAPTETAFDWPAEHQCRARHHHPAAPAALHHLSQLTQGAAAVPAGRHADLARHLDQDRATAAFQVCTLAGLTGEPSRRFHRRAASSRRRQRRMDLPRCTLPDGKTHFLCVQAGQTGAEFMIPQFNNTLHAQTATAR
jgi:hypothetical protein